MLEASYKSIFVNATKLVSANTNAITGNQKIIINTRLFLAGHETA